jgi:hypothetical protein
MLTCAFCGKLDHTHFSSQRCLRHGKWKRLRSAKPTGINCKQVAALAAKKAPCIWCGETNHTRVTSKKCPRHNEWKKLNTKQRRQESKRRANAKIKETQQKSRKGFTPCAWCDGNDHARVTSKKCPRHNEWKKLNTKQRRQESQRMANAKIKETQQKSRKGFAPCAWCDGNDHACVTSKKCPRHNEWKKLNTKQRRQKVVRIAEAKRKGGQKRQESRKGFEESNARRQQTYRYMEKARETDVYHSLKHRFARYAAADLANRTAGHVHQDKEEVIGNLVVMTDADLVKILKKWEKHCKKGANRSVCATCGIIGLIKPTKFSIADSAINAFKVHA